MKANIKNLAILLAFIVPSVIFTKHASAQEASVSFQVFYDQLSPYGQWVDNPNYGYVWIPNAGPDFAPYSTGGHWILTEYGWTWISDYNWGWAPFHYGRWNYDNFYGWLWVPDNEWGPSWVTWRRSDGYYGWEPMEPGMSINISFGKEYNSNNDHWMFVRDRDIERSNINHYYVNKTDHDRIVKNSTVINKTFVDSKRNTTYVSGPAREDIEKITGKKISPVAIKESNKPGQQMSNGQLELYKPQVQKNDNNEKKPAPLKIANLKDVKKPSERNITNQPNNVNPQKNNNNKVQPLQKKNANPSNNNTKKQQPNNVSPQKNNNKVQPLQQTNVSPSNNNAKKQQPNNVSPQKNNNNMTQPLQQKNVNPSNNAKKQQPNNVNPQKNNNNMTQPIQQKNVNPSNNNGKQQPNTINPLNNNVNTPPKNSDQGKKRTD